ARGTAAFAARADPPDLDRRADLAERERLGWIDEPRDVIQMRVRHDRVLDRELLRNGERAGDRTTVDQDFFVDEEGRRAMPQPFASEGTANPNFNSLAE